MGCHTRTLDPCPVSLFSLCSTGAPLKKEASGEAPTLDAKRLQLTPLPPGDVRRGSQGLCSEPFTGPFVFPNLKIPPVYRAPY